MPRINITGWQPYSPLVGEADLRAAALRARVVVHVDIASRKAGRPCIELFQGRQLGVFATTAEAIAFLERFAMTKGTFPKPTPLRAPRQGPGAPEHPQPRQGEIPHTIGMPQPAAPRPVPR